MSEQQILVVDDEPFSLDLFARMLDDYPWQVTTVGDSKKALTLLCDFDFDVAVVDLYMPSPNGIELVKAAKDAGVRTNFILMTAHKDREDVLQNALEAGQVGALAFLEKPFGVDNCLSLIQESLEKYRVVSSGLAGRLDAYLRVACHLQSLDLQEVAEAIGTSPGYVSKLCQRSWQATFRSRLAYHRVQKAKEMLEAKDKTLRMVAEACGFSSRERMTEAFGRVEGMSPKEYRDNPEERQER